MKKYLILFDKENQEKEVDAIKSWGLNYNFVYCGYTIKESCTQSEIDLEADGYILLTGESTKHLSLLFFRDLTSIVKTLKPILCLNLNGFVDLEENICPPLLYNVGAIHMAFSKEDLRISLDYLKDDTRIKNPNSSFHFKKYQPPFDE